MKRSGGQVSISTAVSLALLVLFALCNLCVLLAGGGVYSRLVSGGQESYARRTAAQYLSARVRGCAGADAVTVEAFGDTQALVLRSEEEGEEYLTRVYCHDGWLMELFSAADGDFTPADGEKLLEAERLAFSLEDDLLEAVVVSTSGVEDRLVFSLRGGAR